jgi:endonuclease III
MRIKKQIAGYRTDDKKLRLVLRLLEKNLGIPRRKSADELPPPIDMLIATILSQNTNDSNSHRAFVSLKNLFPEYDYIIKAPRRSLESAIRSGGMARQKSERIRELLKTIKSAQGSLSLTYLNDMSDSEVLRELTSFKGVGLKTASCVLLFSMGREAFPVDTHIHRILNRIGIVRTKTPEQTFHSVGDFIPKGKAYSLHTNLIRFGRSICKAQQPLCGMCPLTKICEYDKKSFVSNSNKRRDSNVIKRRDFMLLDNV